MATEQWRLRGCVRLCIVAALTLGIQVLGLTQSPNSAARPDRGVRPNGTYSVSDIENISLTNGNLNLSREISGSNL